MSTILTINWGRGKEESMEGPLMEGPAMVPRPKVIRLCYPIATNYAKLNQLLLLIYKNITGKI